MRKKEKTDYDWLKSSKNLNESRMEDMGLSKIALQNETSIPVCYTTYNVLQVRENSIVKYSASLQNTADHNEMLRANLKQVKNTYQGEISPAGIKKISKIIYLWSEAVKNHNYNESIISGKNYRKLNMITLTLSDTQIHSDKEIKRALLKPFLRIIRERFGLENYLWKAEKQENGNIHFHIIVDGYFDKVRLREVWNNVQASKGYLDSFHRKYGHYDAPSTRIESLRDIENTTKYIRKYITKDAKYGKIEGAIWKASAKLQTLCYYTCDESVKEVENIEKSCNDGKCEMFCFDNFTLYYFSVFNLPAILSPKSMYDYRLFLNLMCDFLFTNVEYESFKQEFLRVRKESNFKLAKSELIDNYVYKRKEEKKLKELQQKLIF